MLTTEKIKKYRSAIKKMGVWDKDYSSIKNDLMGIIADVRNRDFALDVLGASYQQMLLMARLITYGDSEVEMSEEDLKALFSPLESLSDLSYTPHLLTPGVADTVNGLFPLFFKVMANSKDINEFEIQMRHAMARPAHTPTFSLSYGIALGICMRKCPETAPFLPELIKRIDKLVENSDMMEGIKKHVENHQKSGLEGQSYLFTTYLTAAIVECNYKDAVTYEQMYELISDIMEIAKANHDLYKFLNSREFRFFMSACENYYELEDDKHE